MKIFLIIILVIYILSVVGRFGKAVSEEETACRKVIMETNLSPQQIASCGGMDSIVNAAGKRVAKSWWLDYLFRLINLALIIGIIMVIGNIVTSW